MTINIEKNDCVVQYKNQQFTYGWVFVPTQALAPEKHLSLESIFTMKLILKRNEDILFVQNLFSYTA